MERPIDRRNIVRQFVLDEFLPDVPAGELSDDTDLVAIGAIDSLGLLKVIAWLEDRFGLDVDDLDLEPSAFSSVDSISRVAARAATAARVG